MGKGWLGIYCRQIVRGVAVLVSPNVMWAVFMDVGAGRFTDVWSRSF